ncbi:hypothetical protein F4677DRAFT_444974 [Hypoxylon crocopeplum]|nr:hypothetical protein F4677DRAFT_444974 [Hypoxylon crocopeplum]
MAPNQSNLTDPKYGYDFVVSTTQESINSGLVQYIQNTGSKQPFTYLCFLADENGDPTDEKSLDEILELSGGINPFDIPDGTDWKDERIQELYQARLVCAIRMRTGIPPGCIVNVPNKGPQLQLPEPIVTLGKTSEAVLFNMYCSEVAIIKNNVPSALDKNLDTPYFDAHPEEREALKRKLENLSGTAFSLQQLLFNLQSAVAQTAPTFVGVTDETASYLLGKSFINIWSKIAKEHGLPLIGVTAVAQHPDGSPLRLTALERWMDIRCQEPQSFNWNWVEPQDVAQTSGVISIKRSTMAQYLANEILPLARRSCIKPYASVKANNIFGSVTYSWGFASEQNTKVKVTDSGPIVATLDYSASDSGWDQMAATYGELKLTSTYSCSIVFGDYDWTTYPPVYIGGNTFNVIQNLKVYVYVQWSATGSDALVVDKTLTDEYVVSVNEIGGLTSSPTGNSTVTDNSKPIDVGVIVNWFTGVKDLLEATKNKSSQFLNTHIETIPFNQIKNFVFPGAHVFSYKTASFSNFSDLACLITYVNPTDNQWQREDLTPHRRIEGPPKVIELDEVPPLAAFVMELRAEELSCLVKEGMAKKSGLEIEGLPDVKGSFTVDKVEKGKEDPEIEVVTSNTELMLNYVQGELVKPQGKFRALQAADGTALLFAIDSSGVFNVIEETVAQTQTGWRAIDMSSSD